MPWPASSGPCNCLGPFWRRAQESQSELKISAAKRDLAEEHIRRRERVVQPNGLLQGPLGFVVAAEASERIAQSPIDEPHGRTQLDLALELVERSRSFGTRQEQLTRRNRAIGRRGSSSMACFNSGMA